MRKWKGNRDDKWNKETVERQKGKGGKEWSK